MIFEKGDKVNYGGTENGIVLRVPPVYASKPNPLVWVVFHCSGDWDNYENYTGQATFKKDLKKGWKK
jgi:poly(3-hydroxybutyrate) depolymerase